VAVKTEFSKAEFVEILANYDLGEFRDSRPISKGTVQTNFWLQTANGEFVFRYYENRSREMVLFECDVIQRLVQHHYPCPAAMQNRAGASVGMHDGKPFVLFEFVEGYHVENPGADEREQLIQKAPELHTITEGYQPIHIEQRWNYNVGLCRELAGKAAAHLNTDSAREKLAWLKNALSKLELPESVPKGICHCDLHFENVLFRDSKFAALLDFDHANYTFLTFDLVGLIENFAWPHDGAFDFDKAREVVQTYIKYRALSGDEQRHLFDVYKLSILTDCVWYFARGDAADFYEKRKIEYLDGIGREGFCEWLFG
jgi:homoserine kinase type II